ncbi:MAG: Ig-like domain-containing protein [Patescibacteria group bacterium]
MKRSNNHYRAWVMIAAVAALIVVGSFITVVSVEAQTSFSIENIGGSIGLGTADLKETVINILKWILGIISLAAVSVLIYGGVLWMTAAGREERIEKAKKVIMGAVIGIVIILLSWAIVLFVERFITGSITPGGAICDPAGPEIHPNGCFECNSTGSGWQPLNPLPTFCENVASVFTLEEVETSHGGSFNNDDVHLCSRVQEIYNHQLDTGSIAAAAGDGSLRIERVNNNNTQTKVLGDWGAASNFSRYAQTDHCLENPDQPCTADSDCAGDANTCGVLFQANTDYQAHFPKTIQNTLHHFLQNCMAYGCTENGNEYIWDFHTGETLDDISPVITDTYPVHSPPGYPDHNVSRKPTIQVSFSEPIDMLTVVNGIHPNAANIIIRQLDGQGGNVVSTLDANIFNADSIGQGFQLFLNSNNLFEAFTWYEIEVANIEDLCGNAMTAPLIWQFQTNDSVPGVESVYPADGSSDQCPDTNIMVVFGTTMYNNWVQLDVIGGSRNITIRLDAANDFASGPYEYVDINTGDTIRVMDPGSIADNMFRVFELDIGDELDINTTYTVTVTSDLQMDADGGTLSHSWQFTTSTPESCACQPAVGTILPDQGPRGMCVTIVGQCFTGTVSNTGIPLNPAQVTNIQYAANYDNDPAVIASLPVDGLVGTPTSTNVTSNIPLDFSDGDRVKALVTIAYDNAAYGTFTSNSPNNFFVYSDDLAEGPCLLSLNPNQGIYGAGVNAHGIRFGDGTPGAQAVTEVLFTNGNPSPNNEQDAGHSSWNDTDISTVVWAWATSGNVKIRNDIGTSNPIFFTVLPASPSQPQVLDHWPTCDTACLNAGFGANFNLQMDSPTINSSSVHIWRCDSPACDSFDQQLNIPTVDYTYSASNPFISRATWAPDNNLEANRWYRVVMNNSIQAPDGTGIVNVNFDDPNINGTGDLDSYSWIFKTSDAPCAIDHLETIPVSAIRSTLNTNLNYLSTPLGQADNCTPLGQPLNPNGYTWEWSSSNILQATVSGETDNTEIATTVGETFPGPPVNICARIPAEGQQDCGSLVIDLAHCDETMDCADPNNDGTDECSGSTCDDLTHRCTPVINNLSPDQGPIGQWTTVGGCYFGSYVANGCSVNGNSCLVNTDCAPGICNGSRIAFTDSKQGLWPLACGPAGSTWTNNTVVVEVPDKSTDSTNDDAADGPVTLYRAGDNVSANSSDSYKVTTESLGPLLCYANPNVGSPQTLVTLVGDNLGTQDMANDSVKFYNSLAYVDAAAYESWSNNQIQIRAPSGMENNENGNHDWYPGEIAVFKGALESNAVDFTVQEGSCAVTCSTDAACVSDLGAGYGCGNDGCCYPTPAIQSATPADGAVDVCRNAMLRIVFTDEPAMDVNTLNSNNIRLSYVATTGTLYQFPISVARDAHSISFIYGLLAPGTVYTVTVTDNVISDKGVHFPNDITWTFTTLPETVDGSGFCELERIEVVPTYHSFTAADQTEPFTAYGYDRLGQLLAPIQDVYDWNWSWNSSVPTVAAIDSANNNTAVVRAIGNGSALITATANAVTGWSGSRAGIASVDVQFCENPWSITGTATCAIGTCTENLNFFTGYCLGNAGQTLLPELIKNIPVRGQLGGSTLLRQYLFKHPDKDDGIGIRVFDNPGLLSVRNWYEQEVPNPGATAAMTVDGYEAIKDGTSVYVGTVNLVGGELKGRIFLISVNHGAESDTTSMFDQIIKNFRFNTNISDNCQIDPPVLNKTCIIRDLRRLNDLKSIARLLSNYRGEGQTSGTNLVKNPGFENVASGSTTPSDWSFGDQDSLTKHGGINSVKLGANSYSYQDVPVEQGKQYIISGWLKTDLTVGRAALTAQCVNSTHNVDSSSNCRLNHTNGSMLEGKNNWIRQSFIVEANLADRPYVRISCYNGPPGYASAGVIWCDDLSVVTGATIYPDLIAGSFIVGLSTSRWDRSWKTTLGNALGQVLPVDPLNTLENCPAAYDQSACWDENNTTFYCEPGDSGNNIPASHIYAYQSDNGADYDLYANLEYGGAGNWKDSLIEGQNICNDGRSSCACFNYVLTSP